MAPHRDPALPVFALGSELFEARRQVWRAQLWPAPWTESVSLVLKALHELEEEVGVLVADAIYDVHPDSAALQALVERARRLGERLTQALGSTDDAEASGEAYALIVEAADQLMDLGEARIEAIAAEPWLQLHPPLRGRYRALVLQRETETAPAPMWTDRPERPLANIIELAPLAAAAASASTPLTEQTAEDDGMRVSITTSSRQRRVSVSSMSDCYVVMSLIYDGSSEDVLVPLLPPFGSDPDDIEVSRSGALVVEENPYRLLRSVKVEPLDPGIPPAVLKHLAKLSVRRFQGQDHTRADHLARLARDLTNR